MPEAPDFLGRLKQYEAMLNSRIGETDDRINSGFYTKVHSVELLYNDIARQEAYRSALERLRNLFPELAQK